jgi:K+-sensing histidine kinase KdpD
MASSQVQALLRFLSQDARVPLATAMGKVAELIKADLSTYGT